jgi:3-methyladenine DNA glycosylase/8-oxoguanine DNA glycosylase
MGTQAAAAIHHGDLPFDRKTAVRHLRRVDPVLGELIGRVGPFSLQIAPLKTPFAALARSITYQQLSGKAAATIFGRVQALFPKREELIAQDIANAEETALRGAGLSRNKVLALKDLAAKCLDGTVPTLEALEQLSDEEIIERLIVVRGVGRWTAEMVLMFRLGRPDILPVDDLGVRKGFMLTYKKRKLPTAEQLERHARIWRPYRSVASWYMWRAVEILLPLQ